MRAGNFNANRLRGKRAKFAGIGFEKQVAAMAGICGMSCTFIPSSCKWVGSKPIPVVSPFDLILHWSDPSNDHRYSAFVDLKTRDNGRFSYSDITAHQIQALTRASCGGPAGLIVGFPDSVYFFSVHVVRQLSPGKSLEPIDGILLGSRLSFDLRLLFSEF